MDSLATAFAIPVTDIMEAICWFIQSGPAVSEAPEAYGTLYCERRRGKQVRQCNRVLV
jgi:hypothetical protein